jgi:hypothetical protein
MKMQVKDYYVDGIAKDQDWIVKNREYLEEELHKDMRDKGFIPVLDIPMKVTWEYISKKGDKNEGKFKFRMTAKGHGVGCRKAKKFLGILSEEGIMFGINGESVELAA